MEDAHVFDTHTSFSSYVIVRKPAGSILLELLSHRSCGVSVCECRCACRGRGRLGCSSSGAVHAVRWLAFVCIVTCVWAHVYAFVCGGPKLMPGVLLSLSFIEAESLSEP